MSAFGTKKPNGDRGLQLTFPAIFTATAEAERLPFAYFPDPQSRPPVMESANDVQGFYHAQKQADANRMVMASLESQKASDFRKAHSHAGYFGMPRPVLGQRRFANPSNGNQADIYSNRPVYASSVMSGGVLYTSEAQQWGRNKLKDRIEQLNAIDAAKQGLQMGDVLGESPFRVPISVPEGALPEPVSTKAKIELVATLQSIYASIQSGRANNLAYSDVVKFLRLLFRWGSTADDEELKEIMEYVDGIEQSLLGIEANMLEGRDADAERVEENKYWDEILDTMRKVREYLRRMIGVANLSPSERRSASATFVKTLGFASLAKAPSAESARQQLNDSERADSFLTARRAGLPAEAYDEDDDDVFQSPLMRARMRIDEAPRAQGFDINQREVIGNNNGAFFGEDLPEGALNLRNPFRNMADAEMTEEREAPEPPRRRRPLVAPEPSPEEREALELMRRRAPSVSNETTMSSGVSGYNRPEWLSRRTLADKTASELRAIALRLSNEGYGVYAPRNTTDGPTVRRRIITLWNL